MTRNMRGVIKPFDSADHSRNDQRGRDMFRRFLNRLHKTGNRTIDNPDRYGIDLLTLTPDDVVVRAWEIEVREHNWKGDVPFPFREINCIERKEYLWRKDKEFYDKIPFSVDTDCQVMYVQINDACTRAVIIPGSVVLKYPLKPWSNRKCDGEYVRQVPVEKTIQVNIQG